jgi:hypothetical protein
MGFSLGNFLKGIDPTRVFRSPTRAMNAMPGGAREKLIGRAVANAFTMGWTEVGFQARDIENAKKAREKQIAANKAAQDAQDAQDAIYLAALSTNGTGLVPEPGATTPGFDRVNPVLSPADGAATGPPLIAGLQPAHVVAGAAVLGVLVAMLRK